MSRTFLASASPSAGLAFTTRRPWFMDRTSGQSIVKGEVVALDLAFRSSETTNRTIGDPNSCWSNVVRLEDYEDHDNAIVVVAESDTQLDGRVRCYVWGNEIPATVVNYAQDAVTPTPVGRPIALPFAAASPYSHDMRYVYCASFQNDATVPISAAPHTDDGKYINFSRYVGYTGKPLAQATTTLTRIAFDGWAGFGSAGAI